MNHLMISSTALLPMMRYSVSVYFFHCPIIMERHSLKSEEKYWKHDDLFTKQSYYTLLFEREEDMDLVGANTLTSVQVEWIFMPKRMVKKYCFERI